MSEKEKLVTIIIDKLLGINLTTIKHLLTELEALNPEQLRSIYQYHFSSSEDKRKEAVAFISEACHRIERIVKIYKAVKEAEDQGLYDAAEHLSGCGYGIELSDEEIQDIKKDLSGAKNTS